MTMADTPKTLADLEIPIADALMMVEIVETLAETAFTLCRHDVSFLMKLLQAGP